MGVHIPFLWKLSAEVGVLMAGFLLATTADGVSLVGSAGFTAFALTGFGLMWRSWRKELNRLAFNLYKKEKQCVLLLNTCIRHGIEIPDGYNLLEKAENAEELL